MEVTMGADEVIDRIKKMRSTGQSVSKKIVKEQDPELMRSALYYFPTWDHALSNADNL